MDKAQVRELLEQASREAGRLSITLHRYADSDFRGVEPLQQEYADAKGRLNKALRRVVAEYPDFKTQTPGVQPTPQPQPEPQPETPEQPAEDTQPEETRPEPVPQPVQPVVVVTPETPAVTPIANPERFNGLNLFINPNSSAAGAADRAAPGSHEQRVFRFYAGKPIAFWYGGWGGALDGLRRVVELARRTGQVITVVLYNIPSRDASGGYSAGGISYEAYPRWRDEAIAIVGDTPCIWIVEPDALPDLDALDSGKQQQRIDLIRNTGIALKRQENSWVYFDAGNYSWHNPETMADRLRRAGVENVDGFSCNVSGFGWQDQSMAWCNRLANLLDTHFVIDTSRNGAGPWTNPAGPQWDDWCNPPGRLLGLPPQIQPTDLCDAFLWVKPVGESDGNCKGGPNAGEWYGEYAVELARRAVPRT